MLHHKLCGVGAVVALCASPALASPVSLEGQGMSLFWLMFSRDGFTVGDKHFSDVSFHSYDIGPWDLRIVPVDLGPAGGIGFDIVPNAGYRGSSTDDITFKLKYTVTAMDPNFRISDAHLEFDAWYDDGNDRTGGSHDAGVEVHESLESDGAELGEMRVFADKDGSQLTDWLLFAPVESVEVEKWFRAKGDFSVDRTGGHYHGDPDVGVTYIRQTFTQVAIPAPGAMIAMGLAGLPLVSRRHRQA